MAKISQTLDDINRYQCFFVFDPASIRVSESDIMFIGDKVTDVFASVMASFEGRENDLKVKIMMNRLQKISNMLDLLENYDNIIITKFFDRIWRRYSYISHLGEYFLDLPTFLTVFPDCDKNIDFTVAQRLDLTDKNKSVPEDDSDDDANKDDANKDDANKDDANQDTVEDKKENSDAVLDEVED